MTSIVKIQDGWVGGDYKVGKEIINNFRIVGLLSSNYHKKGRVSEEFRDKE